MTRYAYAYDRRGEVQIRAGREGAAGGVWHENIGVAHDKISGGDMVDEYDICDMISVQ